jgi:orotidine-5'-phosphate decarboxylase
VDFFKIGNRLFTAEGPRAVQTVAGLGFSIFLDLKFHDIPNTVGRAVASAAALPNVGLLTLHAAGGQAMMRAARKALEGNPDPPLLLGVTILTSLTPLDLAQVGLSGGLGSRAVALARLAKRAGLDGVVTSAHEAKAIRKACGDNLAILIPAVRPANSQADDQSRIATPGEAAAAGANYMVVGRPITAAKDPRSAAAAILAEIAG